jgi:thiamine biosynthesis lipoprotein
LLGTFVEIVARGRDERLLGRGIEAGFDAIARVNRLMSFHNRLSDVSRMNREAFPKGVIVHPWTWQVMKAAKRFAEESHGTFDITVAPWLTKWNYLPRRSYQFSPTASSRDIFLRRNYEVFFRRKLIVDLGGIAKGFAVDRAVDALKQEGIKGGIVNAGGDLRAFGRAAQIIHVRHPAEPRRIAGAVRLRECAMATSGVYFNRRKYRGKYVAPLIDGQTGQPGRELISVSVAEAQCMIADALTKVVFALREKAAGLLAQYGADALLLECDGAPSWVFHSPCDTRDRTRFD